MAKISGVYKITNIITGDFYIGSSKDAKNRWITHKAPSCWVRHPNLKLYQDMAQYGLNNFTFEIIEETDNLREREQYWIDQFKPTYNSNRAKDLNEENYRQLVKKYYENHRDDELARMKEYNNAHRAEINSYYQRLCLYEGKTYTLNVLKNKLSKLGFQHPVQEAKKYLLNEQ